MADKLLFEWKLLKIVSDTDVSFPPESHFLSELNFAFFFLPLAVLRSQNDLIERLKKKREQRMKKLLMEQAVEKDEFDRKVIIVLYV